MFVLTQIGFLDNFVHDMKLVDDIQNSSEGGNSIPLNSMNARQLKLLLSFVYDCDVYLTAASVTELLILANKVNSPIFPSANLFST